MGGWGAVSPTTHSPLAQGLYHRAAGCAYTCVCASQTSMLGMDAIPDQQCWKTRFYPVGPGKDPQGP